MLLVLDEPSMQFLKITHSYRVLYSNAWRGGLRTKLPPKTIDIDQS